MADEKLNTGPAQTEQLYIPGFCLRIHQIRTGSVGYLLSNTTLPVDAVITAIGYDNSSYFYRRFRDHYGCLLGEFREVRTSN